MPANTPLLSTKLHIPAPRVRTVERRRLFERLDAADRHRLILVTAPAGYGKTTLLAEWLSARNKTVAWVSLDQSENDPLIFLAYVMTALRDTIGVCQTAEGLLQSTDPPPPDVILTYVLNDLTCSEQPVTLVFDDYHLIDNPAVRSATDFLIENAPPTLQVVILARQTPALPLARWRARRQVTDIDSFDLRFNLSEATHFLNDVMGMALPADSVARLADQTEGWVTGLQLAALSLQGLPTGHEFTYDLIGQDRLIVGYLVDEVLHRQTPAVQQFLLGTAVLDRFNAALSNAVLDATDARDMIAQADAAKLFIIALDNRGEWYRYHHLFGEMLLQRLTNDQPERVPALLLRAAQWHADQQQMEDAIKYALRGQHWNLAAELLAMVTMDYQNSSKRVLLITWIKQLPARYALQHDLWMHYVLSELYFSRFVEARTYVDQTVNEQTLADVTDPDERRRIEVLWQIITATICLHTTIDAAHVRRSLRTTLPAVQEADGLGYSIVWGHFGSASLQLGFIEDAGGALEEAFATASQRSAPVRQVFAAYLAEAYAVRGDLTRAERAFRRAHHAGHVSNNHEGDTFSNVLFGLGSLLFERNVITEADELITRGAAIANRSKSIDRMLQCFEVLLRLRLAQKRYDDIAESLHIATTVAALYENPPIVISRLNALKARLALARGDTAQALAWAQRFSQSRPAAPSDALHDYEWRTAARIQLAAGDVSEAQVLIDAIHDVAKRQGRMRHVIEIGALRVTACLASGNHDLAREVLVHTLQLAVAEGYIRTFIDEGEPMRACLRAVLTQEETVLSPDVAAYTEVLLREFEQDTATSSAVPRQDQSASVASLTPRERDVLRQLAAGQTYVEIAEHLAISENTLKFHIKNVYSKLDVRNRTQAVLKAHALDLA